MNIYYCICHDSIVIGDDFPNPGETCQEGECCDRSCVFDKIGRLKDGIPIEEDEILNFESYFKGMNSRLTFFDMIGMICGVISETHL